MTVAGKAGARSIPPRQPEWIKTFELRNPQDPGMTGKTKRSMSQQIARSFKLFGLPFKALDLYVCWLLRPGAATPLLDPVG